jgi:hypothetical protein
MSKAKNLTPGQITGIVILSLLVLLISALIYGSSILKGKTPVPQVAVRVIAKKAGIPESEQENLEKALNVYSILQKSDVSGDFKELRNSAVRGASQEEMAVRAYGIYTTLPESTLESIRKEWEISQEDFTAGKIIVDKAMNEYAATGTFTITSDEEATLRDLGEKYGVSEESLSSWAKY